MLPAHRSFARSVRTYRYYSGQHAACNEPHHREVQHYLASEGLCAVPPGKDAKPFADADVGFVGVVVDVDARAFLDADVVVGRVAGDIAVAADPVSSEKTDPRRDDCSGCRVLDARPSWIRIEVLGLSQPYERRLPRSLQYVDWHAALLAGAGQRLRHYGCPSRRNRFRTRGSWKSHPRCRVPSMSPLAIVPTRSWPYRDPLPFLTNSCQPTGDWIVDGSDTIAWAGMIKVVVVGGDSGAAPIIATNVPLIFRRRINNLTLLFFPLIVPQVALRVVVVNGGKCRKTMLDCLNGRVKTRDSKERRGNCRGCKRERRRRGKRENLNSFVLSFLVEPANSRRGQTRGKFRSGAWTTTPSDPTTERLKVVFGLLQWFFFCVHYDILFYTYYGLAKILDSRRQSTDLYRRMHGRIKGPRAGVGRISDSSNRGNCANASNRPS